MSPDVMRLPRRTDSHIKSEQFSLNTKQNKIRELRMKAGKSLRSARDHLQELRDDAPPFSFSIPRQDTNKKPSLRKSLKSGMRSALKNEKNRREIELHASEIAKQERIVREGEMTVEDLEGQFQELESQKEYKAWERDQLKKNNR